MIDSLSRGRILTSVEEGFAEQVAFTKEAIRFQSLRGSEHACQDFVFRAMNERGFVVDRFKMDRLVIEAHPGGAPFSPEHSDAPFW